METTRRNFAAGISIGIIAGCLGDKTTKGNQSQQTDISNLRGEGLYFGKKFDREVPEYINIVKTPIHSDVAIFPPDTKVEGQKVVKWLRKGLSIGIVGESSDDRMISLLRTGDAKQYFNNAILGAGKGKYNISAVKLEQQEQRLITSFVSASRLTHRWPYGLNDALRGLE